MGGMHGDSCVDTTLSKLNNPHLLSKESYAECIEHDILRMLSHLEGVNVVANVEVDLDKRINQVITQHEKGAVVRRDSTSRNSESTSPAAREGEPGVRTNADEPGVAPNQGATAASAPTNTETDESTTEEMIPNRIETQKEIAGLTPKRVGVVISVPRKYMEATTDAAGVAQPAAMTEAEIISSVVALGYPGLTEESVRVVRYTPEEVPAEEAPAGFAALDLVMENISSILFGILGIAAIIVAIVVSRRAPVEKVDRTELEEEARDQEEEPLLPEMPADVSALRYEKMQETINQMVGSSPESAASLVRRWIAEDEL
jgi:flagellar biosynthesis/type III secretory pathway M-ring protein FliF/YscJ